MIDARFVLDLEVLLAKEIEVPPRSGDFVTIHSSDAETSYRVMSVTWYFGPASKIRGGGDFLEVRLRHTKPLKKPRPF